MSGMEFDPYSEDYWNGAYDTYRMLRDEAPLYRNDRRNFWALSRYVDVHEAFRDFKTFVSGQGIMLDQLNTDGFNSEESFPGFVIGTDPPTHTELRGLVNRSFSARSVELMEEAVRKIVRHHLERLEGEREFELCAEFANRVPADVLYNLMGVPEADRDRVYAYNEDFNDVGEPGDTGSPPSERHLSGQLNMVQYVCELAEYKRQNPGDDMITEIIDKSIVRRNGEEGPLNQLELGGFLLTVLGAGVETTTKMLAGAMVAFHRNPAEWRKILDDPGKIPAAVEEVGRYDPPLHYMGRKAIRDVTIHGVTVPAQSNFLLLGGAANRDERVYPEPDRFNIDREMPKPPLTFGFGPHLCLGAALARLEMRVALEEIAAAWPRFEVDEAGLERARSFNTAGYTKVPLSVS